MKFYCFLSDNLKWYFPDRKYKKALELLIKNTSYRKLNRVLRNRFGSGVSFRELSDMKRRLLLPPGTPEKIYKI